MLSLALSIKICYNMLYYEIYAVRDDKKQGVFVNGEQCENGILPPARRGETVKAEVFYK